MSTTSYLGTNAAFYYQSSQASTSYWVFRLAVPLREMRPAWRAVTYVADSLDLSQRQVFTILSTASSGTYELLGTIRYDNDRQGIVDFLKSGVQGLTLIYSTNTTASTASTAVVTSSSGFPGSSMFLVEPDASNLDLLLDRQRGEFEDVEINCRFRRTDRQNFSTLF